MQNALPQQKGASFMEAFSRLGHTALVETKFAGKLQVGGISEEGRSQV